MSNFFSLHKLANFILQASVGILGVKRHLCATSAASAYPTYEHVLTVHFSKAGVSRLLELLIQTHDFKRG